MRSARPLLAGSLCRTTVSVDRVVTTFFGWEPAADASLVTESDSSTSSYPSNPLIVDEGSA